MPSGELLSRVRELRASGLQPAGIARELGLTKAQLAPLLRQTAGSARVAVPDEPLPVPAERTLLGCWVNPGWSSGLDLGSAPDWAALDEGRDDDFASEGLVGVFVARAERQHRVTVCGFLVDVYCLGVKNCTGPDVVGTSAVDARVRRFFGAFDVAPSSAPPALAQRLVHGAAAYAAALGFQPHEDFDEAAPYLGESAGECPIRFGREGKPLYISGPHDNARAVVHTLTDRLGAGNFEFIVPA